MVVVIGLPKLTGVVYQDPFLANIEVETVSPLRKTCGK